MHMLAASASSASQLVRFAMLCLRAHALFIGSIEQRRGMLLLPLETGARVLEVGADASRSSISPASHRTLEIRVLESDVEGGVPAESLFAGNASSEQSLPTSESHPLDADEGSHQSPSGERDIKWSIENVVTSSGPQPEDAASKRPP